MSASKISIAKVFRVIKDAAMRAVPCPTNEALGDSAGLHYSIVSIIVRALAAEKRIVMERDGHSRRIRVDGYATAWSKPRFGNRGINGRAANHTIAYDTRAYEEALAAQGQRFTDASIRGERLTGKLPAIPDTYSHTGCAAQMAEGS